VGIVSGLPGMPTRSDLQEKFQASGARRRQGQQPDRAEQDCASDGHRSPAHDDHEPSPGLHEDILHQVTHRVLVFHDEDGLRACTTLAKTILVC
jgi:hypothetical protein